MSQMFKQLLHQQAVSSKKCVNNLLLKCPFPKIEETVNLLQKQYTQFQITHQIQNLQFAGLIIIILLIRLININIILNIHYKMQLSETKQVFSPRELAGHQQKYFSKNAHTNRATGQISKLNLLLSQLSIKSKTSIQAIVKSKSIKLIEHYKIDFTKINSLTELKYIIFRMLQNDAQNIEPLSNSALPNYNYQSPTPIPAVSKKTNIYIDFDFTQLIEKTQFQLSQKDHIIEKLQDMMIDKDNEIDILEDENQQMRRQIQQIAEKNYNDKAFHENEKLHFEGKTKGIQEENKKLKDEIKALAKDITAFESENKQQPDQFLRRCLLTQAISIQHFLKNYQES